MGPLTPSLAEVAGFRVRAAATGAAAGWALHVVASALGAGLPLPAGLADPARVASAWPLAWIAGVAGAAPVGFGAAAAGLGVTGLLIGLPAGALAATAVHVLGMLAAALLARAHLEAQRRDRAPTLRLGLVVASFGALVLWLLPAALAAPLPGVVVEALPVLPRDLLLRSPWRGELAVPWRVPGAAVALGAGALLFAWALRHLTRGGGTPDPFDPPRALATTGPYRHLRHPMQLGQMLLVVGAALLHHTWGAVLFAAVLIVGLVIARRHEEQQVAVRFAR